MRGVGHGGRGEKNLQELHPIGALHPVGKVLVQLRHLRTGIFLVLAIGQLLQQEELHPLAPELSDLLLSPGERRLGALGLEVFIDRKILLLRGKLLDPLGAFSYPPEKHLAHLEGKIQFS